MANMYRIDRISRVAQRVLGLVIFSLAAYSATPALLYSDLDSGPATGGENNHGVYICVFGTNFGTTQGTSTITVGGVPAAAYAYWGTPGTGGAATAQACFQMGAATPIGQQNIVLTVGGVPSNSSPFTVRSNGAIYCVDSVNGSDANNGRFTTDSPAGTGCKATLQTAYNLLHGGDTLYVRSGTYTSLGNLGAVVSISGSGSAGNPKVIDGYPGATSTIGLDNDPTVQYGVFSNGAYTQGCDYHTIANLQTVHGTQAAIGIWGCGHVRVINNRATCPYENNDEACIFNSSGYVNGTVYYSAYNTIYGNEVYNVATSVPAQNIGYTPPPYTITTGSNDQMSVTVNGGASQNITLAACTRCTGATICADFNSKVTGATCSVFGSSQVLGVSTTTGGNSSSLLLSSTSNSAYTTLGLTYIGSVITGGAGKLTHSLYVGTASNNVDVGWNNVHNNNACRGIQMHSSPIIDGWTDDPTGAPLYNILLHDNIVHDVGCDGLNPNTVDPSKGYVKVYNNIVYNAGQNTATNLNNSGTGSGIYSEGRSNQVFATAASGCQITTNLATVTGNSNCHFHTVDNLQPGWQICHDYTNGASHSGAGDPTCYFAAIQSVDSDTTMTLYTIPAPYNRPWYDYGAGSPWAYGPEPLIFTKCCIGQIQVYNNTFYNNSANRQGGAYCRAGASPLLVMQLTNNVVYQTNGEEWYCPGQLSGDGTHYVAGSNDLFFNSGTSGQSVPSFFTAIVTSDPQFVNASLPDFHLQQSSPAANAALTTALPPNDFDGNKRPQTVNGAVGAYEYSGVASQSAVQTANPCDLNGDGVVDQADVLLAIDQTIGVTACGNLTVLGGGSCNVTGIQRVVNAMQGACILP